MSYTWKTLGHEPIINFLEKSIANQKLSHAYLFYGPAKIGKHHLALRFSQILQCQKNQVARSLSSEQTKTIPCGHCVHCQQIKKSIHPDIYSVIKPEDKKISALTKSENSQENSLLIPSPIPIKLL